MQKHVINTAFAPAAIGPYSQAVECDGWLFCSGQIALDPATGKIAGDSIEDQTAQVLKNLGEVLKTAGMDFSNIIKTTVFLKSMDDFSGMNAVYGHYFSNDAPARATVEVSRLPKDVKVEIDAVAKKF